MCSVCYGFTWHLGELLSSWELATAKINLDTSNVQQHFLSINSFSTYLTQNSCHFLWASLRLVLCLKVSKLIFNSVQSFHYSELETGTTGRMIGDSRRGSGWGTSRGWSRLGPSGTWLYRGGAKWSMQQIISLIQPPNLF